MDEKFPARAEPKRACPLAQAALAAAAALLAACSPPAAPVAESAPTPSPVAATAPGLDGASLYEQSCAMCHFAGADSEAAPALIGSEMVKSDPAELVRVILHGRSNESVVNGRLFGGVMPPTQGLTDEEVAAVATFVHQTYGGSSGVISAADVAKER